MDVMFTDASISATTFAVSRSRAVMNDWMFSSGMLIPGKVPLMRFVTWLVART